MKSKRFFNKALLKHAFSQTWAVSLFVLILKLIFVVIPAYSGSIEIYDGGADYVIDPTGCFVYIVGVFFFAVAVCFLLFGFLCSERLSLSVHSFPVRRSQLFAVNYSVGLGALLVPDIIGTLACLPVILLNNKSLSVDALKVILINLPFVILFLWAVAVLSIMLCGNAAGTVITVLMFHFAPIALIFIADMVFTDMIYGYYGVDVFERFLISPFLHFFEQEYPNDSLYLALSFVLSAVLSALAFVAYKKRRPERTGDAFMFRIVRVVFQLAAVIGGVYALFLLTGQFIDIEFGGLGFVLTFIVYPFIVFVITEMFAEKTLKPLNKCSMLRLGIYISVICVAFFGIKIYYEHKTVNPNRVEKAYVVSDFCFELDESEGIAAACELQRTALKNKAEYKNTYTSSTDDIYVVFEMKNGPAMIRKYPFRPNKERLNEEKSIESIIVGLETTERMENALLGIPIDEIRLSSKTTSRMEVMNKSVRIEDEEFLKKLLRTCVEDLEHGADHTLLKYRLQPSTPKYYDWWREQPESKVQINGDPDNMYIDLELYLETNDDEKNNNNIRIDVIRTISDEELRGFSCYSYDSGIKGVKEYHVWIDMSVLKKAGVVAYEFSRSN